MQAMIGFAGESSESYRRLEQLAAARLGASGWRRVEGADHALAVLDDCRYPLGSRILADEQGGRTVALSGHLWQDGVPPGREERVEAALLARAAALSNDPGAAQPADLHGLFRLAIHDRRGARLLLACDPSALLPLYYSLRADGLVFASHMHLLARAVGAAPSPAGLLQMVNVQYCVGADTLYSGVSRLQPGQRLLYDRRRHAVEVTEAPELFQELDERTDADLDELADRVWERLVAACARVGRGRGPIGVMLSGGLDSRMVVAGFEAAGVPMISCTHGQAGFQEVRVAEATARLAGASHSFLDVARLGFLGSAEEQRQLFWKSDAPLLPVWRLGGEHLRAAGATAFSSGFMLDASLGGHFNEPVTAEDRLRRRVRYALRGPSPRDFQQLASQRYVDEFVATLRRRLEKGLRYRAPLLTPAWREALEAAKPAALAGIEAELARLRRTGTRWPSKLVERFLTEDHARRYSFTQESVAAAYLPVVTPTFDRELMRVLTAIHPAYTADHYLYFRIMRRHAPRYARLPGSASGLPLSYPSLLTEAGRALRNRYDNFARTRFMRSRGRIDLARFGAWNTERVARLPGTLEALEELLCGGEGNGFVDAEACRRWLAEIRDYRRKSFVLIELTMLACAQQTCSSPA